MSYVCHQQDIMLAYQLGLRKDFKRISFEGGKISALPTVCLTPNKSRIPLTFKHYNILRDVVLI